MGELWPSACPRQLATREIINQAVAQIRTMREAVGPDIDICLDVNVNFKPIKHQLTIFP